MQNLVPYGSGVCVFLFYFESLLNWFACKNELNQSVMQANGQLFEMKLSYFRPIGWTKILNFWPCLSGAQIFYGFLQAVHEYYNLHEISINFPAEIASPSSTTEKRLNEHIIDQCYLYSARLLR